MVRPKDQTKWSDQKGKNLSHTIRIKYTINLDSVVIDYTKLKLGLN